MWPGLPQPCQALSLAWRGRVEGGRASWRRRRHSQSEEGVSEVLEPGRLGVLDVASVLRSCPCYCGQQDWKPGLDAVPISVYNMLERQCVAG